MTTKKQPTITALLTMKDVKEILQVSQSYAYDLAKSGKLPSVRIDDVVRVKAEDLIAFIEDKRVTR